MKIVELCAPLVIAIASGGLAVPLPCIGPGDVDADSDVDSLDWRLIAPCLAGADQPSPPAGCALENFQYADVERDGDVDLHDAAEFQNVYGDTYFDYGPWLEDKEAERVALKFADGLRAPLKQYEHVHLDLMTIRAEFPEYEDFVFRGLFPADELLVFPADGGRGAALEELARYYQASMWCRHDVCKLTFCDQLNVRGMVAIAEELPEVEYASPNYYIIYGFCPSGSLEVEMPYDCLTYNFWCCDDSWCWRNLAFETSESSEILSIVVSHPYDCVPDCP